MNVDHSNAFRFIFQDEIYLLEQDKANTVSPGMEQATALIDIPITDHSLPVSKLPTPAMIEPEISPVQLDTKTPEPDFNYLGGNNKNFLILLNYPDEQFIPSEHLVALESILKRKGIGLGDVAIVNINKYKPIKLAELVAAFGPVKLLIMGKDAMPDGIGNLPLNQPVQGKKINVLYSFSFAEMMSSNDNKKAFWEQMKTL